MNNHCLKPFILVILLFLASMAYPEEWYISNAAGMALEKAYSRAALREKYALKIEEYGPNKIPPEISEYIDTSVSIPPSFTVELYTLYENSQEKGHRWVLRYFRGTPWIVLSVREDASRGFAEYYDESDFLIQEDTFLKESIISTRHIYKNRILLHSETWQNPREQTETVSVPGKDETEVQKPDAGDKPSGAALHLWTDTYRYTRAGALRSMERIFHSDMEKSDITLTYFTPLGPGYENKTFTDPGPAVSSDFISDIINRADTRIEYITDSHGRVVTEIHKDAEGKKTGELTNIWSGDRLVSITWNGENDTRRIEYEYDSNGDRIIERNFRNGILERLVRIEKDYEVEELYLQGQLVLKAVWKDGQKISEEQIRQIPGRRP